MKILITGGAGYIGSVLTGWLLEKGHCVSVLDNLSYQQNSLLGICHHRGFAFIRGDARDTALLQEILPAFDGVIPLAAIVGAPACDKDKQLATSLNLDAIRAVGRIRSKNQLMIFPSTSSSYGVGEKDRFCAETSPLRPVSHYSRLKMEAEQAVMEFENVIALRFATAFGMSPRLRLDLLVNNFVYRAVRDRAIVIFEPHFRRDYIHIRDIAMTFDYCLEHFARLKNEVFNVGLPEANLTKLELAQCIQRQISDVTLLTSEISSDPDKRDYYVSSEKLLKTGWRPKCSLEEGIRELIKGLGMLSMSPAYSNS